MILEAVIFDMDGILIDSENLWQESEQELFAELGIELGPSHLEESRGLMSAEMVEHWCGLFNLKGADKVALEEKYNAQMVEKFRIKVPLMEGAMEALTFFTAKGIPLALASCSTHEHIDAALEKHDLASFFNFRVSAAEGMPGKPHPEIYLQTAGRLGVDPTRCLAIEDTFYGLVSAKAARMRVVSMPDPHEYHQPRFGAADIKISSLREINEELYTKIRDL